MAGRTQEALLAYRDVLASDPSHVAALCNAAGLLEQMGLHEPALILAQKAVVLAPNFPGARNALATTLHALDREEEAAEQLEAVLRLEPHSARARYNLSHCVYRLGDWSRVLELNDQALSLDPSLAEAHNHRGLALLELGRPEEARLAFMRCLDERPDHPETRRNLGTCQLLLGDFEHGWPNYEARLRTKGPFAPQRNLASPPWDGSPLSGRTLLLPWEQGFGDTLMFLRFARLITGGRVIAEVQGPLETLCRTCPYVEEVIPWGAPLPPHDVHAPLASLPALLGLGRDQVPGPIPYLSAPDVPRREALQSLLGPAAPRRIGLVFQGNLNHRKDHLRSLSPALLSEWMDLPGTTWYSLQKDAPGLIPAPCMDLAPLLEDFSDTAYALSKLDLLITVDTAAAHLAGALGRPTWLLLPWSAEWRWGLAPTTTVWYPSLRLFRQSSPGDWRGVLAQVQAALQPASGP